MAISGGLRLIGAFSPDPNRHPLQCISSSSSSKVHFGGRLGLRSSFCEVAPRRLPLHQNHHRNLGIMPNESSSKNLIKETEGFLLNAVNMDFFARLSLAWRILFPATTARRHSNANVAKQRLKMILFSDRCAVSDEAKQKIVSNIVSALSDFVEIDSQDKVQLSVSTDPDLGTVYSVTVPVRRVKQEYQDYDDMGGITNVEYRDTGEMSGTVDVKFDFFVPRDL